MSQHRSLVATQAAVPLLSLDGLIGLGIFGISVVDLSHRLTHPLLLQQTAIHWMGRRNVES